MNKKFIFTAAVSVALIVAVLIFKSHPSSPQGFEWSGTLTSRSEGSFGFQSNSEKTFHTSAHYSGTLLVKKVGPSFQFQWINPEYELQIGLASNIKNDPQSNLYHFLTQAWVIEGEKLTVSSDVQKLNIDENLLALNLLRKISMPFLMADCKATHDLADHSAITLMDFEGGCQPNKISVEEQSGGTYLKPWSTAKTVYSEGPSTARLTIPSSTSQFSLAMDFGNENLKRSLQETPKTEILASLKNIEKNSALVKNYLIAGLISYPEFEAQLRKLSPKSSEYRAAIVSLVELQNANATQIIVNQLTPTSVYSTLSLKAVSKEFLKKVTEMASAPHASPNLHLIACHFSGLTDDHSYLKPYLTISSQNLSCLGNAGVPEAQPIIEAFLQSQDPEERKQALYSLRFIRTPSALQRLIDASAYEVLQERVERGIYEPELWKHLLTQLKPDSKNLAIAQQLAKSFIMNYPGAFRDSKKEPYAKLLWTE